MGHRLPLFMDAVLQLSDHACFLYYKGHYARSRAKYDAAIAAAAEQASLAGHSDCLVLAGLRLFSLLTEPCFLRQGALSREEFDAGEALDEVSATLRRRRDAGTLCRGRCSPHEERWYVRYVMMCNECMSTPTLEWSRSLAREGAAADRHKNADSTTVGFALYVDVWDKRMLLARDAVLVDVITQDEALARWRCVAEDVVAATGLLATLQEGDRARTLFAGGAELLRDIANICVPVAGPAWCAAVSAALSTLERYCHLSSDEASAVAMKAAQARAELRVLDVECAAAAATATLRTCTLASCGAREAHEAHFNLCSGCRRVAYCSREHQAADWRAHKAACKAARADNDAS